LAERPFLRASQRHRGQTRLRFLPLGIHVLPSPGRFKVVRIFPPSGVRPRAGRSLVPDVTYFP